MKIQIINELNNIDSMSPLVAGAKKVAPNIIGKAGEVEHLFFDELKLLIVPHGF